MHSLPTSGGNMTLADLTDRVAQLEAETSRLKLQVKKWRRYGYALALLLVSALAIGAAKVSEFETVSARFLVVADKEGKTVGSLSSQEGGLLKVNSPDDGGSVLVLATAKGGGIIVKSGDKPRVVIGVNKDGDGYIDVYDRAGRGRSLPAR
jgi:hypothetical protein